MTDLLLEDYSYLDTPEILSYIFHPRKDNDESKTSLIARDILIPVEKDINISGRFYMAGSSFPNILFFHGNGEISGEYDYIANKYNAYGINFLSVDFRGYGKSDGNPTVFYMMKDCHTIFNYITGWLKKQNYCNTLFVMGRSLGSASAIEIACSYEKKISGLIVESGFASMIPLLKFLGADISFLNYKEDEKRENYGKIKKIKKPVLIIHAEEDTLIPFSDGQKLFNSASSLNKKLVKIKGAGHGDIFFKGMDKYLCAIKNFIDSGI